MQQKSNQDFIERRKFLRKEMFLVMEISKTGNENELLRVLTSNVSAGGVYFKTHRGQKFDMGTATNLTIYVSTKTGEDKIHSARLSGTGKVVRLERIKEDAAVSDPWTGVAVQFDKALKIC